VVPPGSYALSIDGDFELGGFVFKDGYPFIHNDGGASAFNTALGLDALVSSTPGVPEDWSGKSNTALGDSALRNNSTGYGNTASGAFALFRNTEGTANTATGFRALANNRTSFRNTASGFDALYFNTTGGDNTASGAFALRYNTTGDGNTASGAFALWANIEGSGNTATGDSALRTNTANGNTAFGYYALKRNSSAFAGTAVGYKALEQNETGNGNVAVGWQALRYNEVGFNNTGLGTQALLNNTGSNNIAVGNGAGVNLTSGASNIHIGNTGVAGETQTLKLGTQGTQTKTFIAGIRGTTTGQANAIPVLIDSNGQLGTVSSSRRFKEDIQHLGGVSDRLLDLRPVTFRFKRAFTDGEKPIQFGLIAEEVAEVLPELVVRDADGRPETVKYHLLSSLLLNEVQKQHREILVHRWLLAFVLVTVGSVTISRLRLG
jgi:hypothetical protein